jgi:hypothetical protein
MVTKYLLIVIAALIGVSLDSIPFFAKLDPKVVSRLSWLIYFIFSSKGG